MQAVNLVGIEEATRLASENLYTGPLLAVVVTGLILTVLVMAFAVFLVRAH